MTNNLSEITNIKGVGSSTLEKFKESGFEKIEDIENMNPEDITDSVEGVGHSKAVDIIDYINGKNSEKKTQLKESESQDTFVEESEYKQTREEINKQIGRMEDKLEEIENHKVNSSEIEEIKHDLEEELEEIEEQKKELREELKEEIKKELKEELKEEIQKGLDAINQKRSDDGKSDEKNNKGIKSKIIGIFVEDKE
jgi:nucleotidyltransferase/DNA polymerase involved in DNA repair